MRQWRACGVLSLAGVLGLTALYLGVSFFRKEAPDGDHAHQRAPHGGVIVSTGDDGAHYHVEALVERGSTLKLYTFGEDLDETLRVDHQILTAQVKSDGGAEPIPVVLMPMPQSGDGEGKASRFFGKLPEALRGKPLTVHVPAFDLAGRQFQLDFTVNGPEKHGGGLPDRGDAEEMFLLSVGGKYTQADIQANGGMTPSRRYSGFEADHDAKPRRGQRLCPISLTKANRKCSWNVNGKTYVFCCPPCIEEFVKRAKHEPQEINDPGMYVKR